MRITILSRVYALTSPHIILHLQTPIPTGLVPTHLRSAYPAPRLIGGRLLFLHMQAG